MRRGKWWFVIALILMVIAGWQIIKLLTEKPQTNTTPKPTVKVQAVTETEKEKRQVFTGNVQSVQEAFISPKIDGKIRSILVDNGDYVNAGETVVILEENDYRNSLTASQGALKKAEAQLASTAADYERIKRLAMEGAVSQKEQEDAGAALKMAEGDFETAQAAVAGASDTLGYTRITSPITGYVANRNIMLGQVLEAGTPMMTIEDISSVYIVVNVAQKELGQQFVALGIPAEMEVEGINGRKFTGTVEIINPVANSSARVFECKIRVPNPDAIIKPGMFARVTIKSSTITKVLAIPQTAIINSSGQYFAYIIDDGVAKRQQITIGDVIGRMVEIKSGLKQGQEIAVTNINKLKEGDRVKVSR